MLTAWMSLGLASQSKSVPPIKGVQVAKATGTARIAHTAEVIGNTMYALYGFTGSTYTGNFGRYDTTTNTWSTLTTLSVARAYHHSAAIGTKLYFGCGTNGVAYYNDWYSCDTTNGQVTTLATPNSQRWYGAAAAVGTKIYAIGGRAGAGTNLHQLIDIYDTATSAWTSISAPTALRGDRPILTVVGTDIYVMINTTFGKFNTLTQIWTPLDVSTRLATTNTSMAAMGGFIYTYCGLVSGALNLNLQAYSIIENTWTPIATSGSAVPVHLNTLVAVNGALYSTAGSGQVSGNPSTGLTVQIT